MRPIKFRAWDYRSKKMRGVMDIKYFDNGNVRVNATESQENYEPLLYMQDYEGKELKEFELMQYTGVKDKNGVEIYEGDIVIAKIRTQRYLTIKGVVSFDSGSFCVAEYLIHCPRELEVIGNIYQNPELFTEEGVAGE